MSERTDHDGTDHDESENATGESEDGYESTRAADTGPETDANTERETRDEAETEANAGTADTDETRETSANDERTRDRTVSLDDSQKGTEVINADGETVGLVTEVDGDRIHVDPDPGLTDRLKAELGWGSADESDTTIRSEQVESVERNEIRLSRSEGEGPT